MRKIVRWIIFLPAIPFIVLETVFADPFRFRIKKDGFSIGIFWITLIFLISHFIINL